MQLLNELLPNHPVPRVRRLRSRASLRLRFELRRRGILDALRSSGYVPQPGRAQGELCASIEVANTPSWSLMRLPLRSGVVYATFDRIGELEAIVIDRYGQRVLRLRPDAMELDDVTSAVRSMSPRTLLQLLHAPPPYSHRDLRVRWHERPHQVGSTVAIVVRELALGAQLLVGPAANCPTSTEGKHPEVNVRGTLDPRLGLTFDALTQMIRRSDVAGVQIYISLGGSVLADAVVGPDSVSSRTSEHSLLPWFCASKIAVGFTALAQCQRMGVDIESPLPMRMVGVAGSDHTLRDLLEHRVGFSRDDVAYAVMPPRRDRIHALLAGLSTTGRLDRARYSVWSSSCVVGALLEALTNETVGDLVASWVASDLQVGERGAEAMYQGQSAVANAAEFGPDYKRVLDGWHEVGRPAYDELFHSAFNPGGGLWASAGFVGELLAWLLRRDARSAELVWTAADEATRDNPFAYGLLACRGPFFGPFASSRSVGHGNFDMTVTVADPDNDLVIAANFLGAAPRVVTGPRNEVFMTAVYSDLLPRARVERHMSEALAEVNGV